ncbi:MAG: YcnI family protein [Mycobacterium sp.]
MFTSLRQVAGVCLVAGAVALIASPAAAAHVDAKADGAVPGGFGVVTLGVPTESGKPNTTKVEVRIPEETPMRTVRAEPVAGWTLDIQKRKIDPPLRKDDGSPVNEVVSTVTWTATGGGIPSGQFQEFALYVGPIPEADTLALPTTQTFSDGSTEAWTEQSAGAEKPKFPVPTVTIGQKPGGGLLPVISWTALGLSVVGLGLGVFAIDRASRRQSAADPAAPAISVAAK